MNATQATAVMNIMPSAAPSAKSATDGGFGEALAGAQTVQDTVDARRNAKADNRGNDMRAERADKSEDTNDVAGDEATTVDETQTTEETTSSDDTTSDDSDDSSTEGDDSSDADNSSAREHAPGHDGQESPGQQAHTTGQPAQLFAPGHQKTEVAATADAATGETLPAAAITEAPTGPISAAQGQALALAAQVAAAANEAAAAAGTVQTQAQTQQVAQTPVVATVATEAADVTTDPLAADAATDATKAEGKGAEAAARKAAGENGAAVLKDAAVPVDGAATGLARANAAAGEHGAHGRAVAAEAQAVTHKAEKSDAPAPAGERPAPLPPQAVSAMSGTAAARAHAALQATGQSQHVMTQERIDSIATQLSARLRLSQAAGGTEVHLSLRPRQLGDVGVALTVKDGVVTANVLVERADTMRALQNNVDELRKALADQGLDIGQMNVDVRDAGANSRADHESAGNGDRTTADASSTDDVEATVSLQNEINITADDLHTGSVSALA